MKAWPERKKAPAKEKLFAAATPAVSYEGQNDKIFIRAIGTVIDATSG
jgi:hypothetical protein